MASLADGSYDGIIVDVTEHDDGSISLELAISSGSQKGNTIAVRVTSLGRNALDVLALPVTLTVDNGAPSVHFD
jgi:hypothetical protein